MNTQINSLAELQAEKKKLKMQMEISKREFFHSFGYTKTQAKDFLVQKVALPAGALGLATVGISKLSASNSASNNKKVRKDESLFLKMMPIVLPMVQAYLSTSGIKLPPFLHNIFAHQKKDQEIFV